MVVLLDVAILSLSVLAPYEVETAGSSTSPPVTAGKTDDGLQDKSDDGVGEVVHAWVIVKYVNVATPVRSRATESLCLKNTST